MRPKASLFLVLLIAALVVAQAKDEKKPVPKGDGPTKVTGKPHSTSSGLQYWDIVQGTGAIAVSGMKVTVNYTGWLQNGKKFDSSIGRGPFSFDLGA